MIQLLVQKWGVPENGSQAYFVDLSAEEMGELEADIAWLEEHAAGEYGGALSEWFMTILPGSAVKRLVGDSSLLVGLRSVRGMMVLESRYEEDPTFYGDVPYAPYAAIAVHWA